MDSSIFVVKNLVRTKLLGLGILWSAILILKVVSTPDFQGHWHFSADSHVVSGIQRCSGDQNEFNGTQLDDLETTLTGKSRINYIPCFTVENLHSTTNVLNDLSWRYFRKPSTELFLACSITSWQSIFTNRTHLIRNNPMEDEEIGENGGYTK